MVSETLETIKKRMESNPDQFLLEILPLWRRYQYKSKRREVNADNLEKNKISSTNTDQQPQQQCTVNCTQSLIPLVNHSSNKTDVTFTVTDCVQDSSFNGRDRDDEEEEEDEDEEDDDESHATSIAAAAAAAAAATVAATTAGATNDMQSNGRQNANTGVSVHQDTKRKRKNIVSSVSAGKQRQSATTLTERMMKVDYNTTATSSSSSSASSLNVSGSYSKDINSLSDKSIHHTRRLEGKMLMNTGNNSSTSGHLTDAEAALIAQMHPMHQRYHLLQPELMSSAFPAAASAAAIAAAGLPTAFPFDLYRCLGSLYSPSNDRN